MNNCWQSKWALFAWLVFCMLSITNKILSRPHYHLSNIKWAKNHSHTSYLATSSGLRFFLKINGLALSLLSRLNLPYSSAYWPKCHTSFLFVLYVLRTRANTPDDVATSWAYVSRSFSLFDALQAKMYIIVISVRGASAISGFRNVPWLLDHNSWQHWQKTALDSFFWILWAKTVLQTDLTHKNTGDISRIISEYSVGANITWVKGRHCQRVIRSIHWTVVQAKPTPPELLLGNFRDSSAIAFSLL